MKSSGAGERGLAPGEYRIRAVKVRDHVQVEIISAKDTHRITAALPDSTRYAYIGLTGTHCRIYDIVTDREEEEVAEDFIPRIAEEISYINVPAGDIPNVQVDGYRTRSTDGISIKNITQLNTEADEIYVAFSGDQVALTNIRITDNME